MTLIFATNNENKVREIQAAIGQDIRIITLQEAGIDIEIPEPFDTLEENASEKSRTIQRLTGADCFSEDTGLETEALHGEPGVKSARYAGESRSFEQNIDKLLRKLADKPNRKARFRTVLSLRLKEKEYLFEGICQGTIIRERRGSEGFGYDPVFVPDGSALSFAEMTIRQKNQFSHRKKAVDKLLQFLKQQPTEKI